ncbi:MAG: flagellar hook-length control protein FliK, partial [Rhizobiales bacterium]|nr:flagellar hook-length control protein FliK [Hyphomicrobiales bacterium]
MVASQPQATTRDALSQLGATMTAPQAPVTTTVPAAQLTATAMTNLAVPVSGLAVQIAASARAGNSRFEIRLDPAEFGRIDVRLDVDRHGNVTSHLTVEKPETLAMLRQDAPQL